MIRINGIEIDNFTFAYIECALWASNDESTPEGGYPMDRNYGPEDISIDTLKKMIADCKDFQDNHWDDISSDVSRAGHDFWLTRNHHGAGFWDGDWNKEVGKRLTDASHAYGDFNLYVGDDGKIYGG